MEGDEERAKSAEAQLSEDMVCDEEGAASEQSLNHDRSQQKVPGNSNSASGAGKAGKSGATHTLTPQTSTEETQRKEAQEPTNTTSSKNVQVQSTTTPSNSENAQARDRLETANTIKRSEDKPEVVFVFGFPGWTELDIGNTLRQYLNSQDEFIPEDLKFGKSRVGKSYQFRSSSDRDYIRRLQSLGTVPLNIKGEDITITWKATNAENRAPGTHVNKLTRAEHERSGYTWLKHSAILDRAERAISPSLSLRTERFWNFLKVTSIAKYVHFPTACLGDPNSSKARFAGTYRVVFKSKEVRDELFGGRDQFTYSWNGGMSEATMYKPDDFIPEPPLCYHCCSFGHGTDGCCAQPRCADCGKNGHVAGSSDCSVETQRKADPDGTKHLVYTCWCCKAESWRGKHGHKWGSRWCQWLKENKRLYFKALRKPKDKSIPPWSPGPRQLPQVVSEYMTKPGIPGQASSQPAPIATRKSSSPNASWADMVRPASSKPKTAPKGPKPAVSKVSQRAKETANAETPNNNLADQLQQITEMIAQPFPKSLKGEGLILAQQNQAIIALLMALIQQNQSHSTPVAPPPPSAPPETQRQNALLLLPSFSFSADAPQNSPPPSDERPEHRAAIKRRQSLKKKGKSPEPISPSVSLNPPPSREQRDSAETADPLHSQDPVSDEEANRGRKRARSQKNLLAMWKKPGEGTRAEDHFSTDTPDTSQDLTSTPSVVQHIQMVTDEDPVDKTTATAGEIPRPTSPEAETPLNPQTGVGRHPPLH